MEINTNLRTNGFRAFIAAEPSGAADTHSHRISFSDAGALENKLKNLPAARAQAVTYARSLIADNRYPSHETLRQISRLLAVQLESETQ